MTDAQFQTFLMSLQNNQSNRPKKQHIFTCQFVIKTLHLFKL